MPKKAGLLTRLFFWINAYRSGMPFRSELPSPKGELWIDDCEFDENDLEECASASEDGIMFVLFNPGWQISQPASMSAFIRALPALELDGSVVFLSDALNPELRPLLNDCLEQHPEWRPERYPDQPAMIEAPVTPENMKALAYIVEAHPECHYCTSLRVQKGRKTIQVFVDNIDGQWKVNPEITKKRVAEFCRRAGCTFEMGEWSDGNGLSLDHPFWRLTPAPDGIAFLHALPELFEGGIALLQSHSIPASARAYVLEHAQEWRMNDDDVDIMTSMDFVLKFPISGAVTETLLEHLETEDLSDSFQLSITQNNTNVLSTFPGYTDLYEDIPEKKLRPWCERLGIRYRRYEHRGFFGALGLALRGLVGKKGLN